VRASTRFSRVTRGRRARGNVESRPTTGAAQPTASKTGAAAPSRRGRPTAAPPGQTRAKILEALKDGPKTAGEIAEATGVPGGSASTTLSKLAKSGEVVKAERGYKLPG
jgi:DNA-binding transcriptional ArsR family regulator